MTEDSRFRVFANFDLEYASCCRDHVDTAKTSVYDNDRKASVFDRDTGKLIGAFTKYDFAKGLYKSIQEMHLDNFEFRIVPHMYLRSKRVRPFSRGNMPYSLHCKTFFAEFHSGKCFAGITSSNLALRDAVKAEMACIIPLLSDDIIAAKDFFQGLYENSFDINSFDEKQDYSHFKIKMRSQPNASRLMYTAPFYRNSPIIFENQIKDIISKANGKIAICAQHVSSYKYSVDGSFCDMKTPGSIEKRGFLDDVLRKAKTGTKTFFISQTYADSKGSHGCRRPENTKGFIDFVENAKLNSCRYCVNENIHSKYIVTDNTALITTSNFTPTQFIYLQNVDIPSFDNIPGYSYSGIFCEFGAYYITEEESVVKELQDYTNTIWRLTQSIKMF